MKSKKDINAIYEQKIIIHCLLKGMNLKQIAKKLNCAKSTASYKTNRLYEQYNCSDRFEFCINIFSKAIIGYKNKILKLENEIEKLRNTY